MTGPAQAVAPTHDHKEVSLKTLTSIAPRTTNARNMTLAYNPTKSSSRASGNLSRIASTLVLMAIFCLTNFQLLAQTASENGKSLIVPPLINYSGVLKDSTGKTLTGTVGATFHIYKDSEGGEPLWTETQNLQVDSNGHYSVMLGSTSTRGLPEDLFAFGEPRWLSLQLQGEQEQPRALLVAVPYALKAADAATIGGLPPSAFVRATPNGVSSTGGSGPLPQTASSLGSPSTSGKLASPLSPCGTLTGVGTTNYLPLWTTGCNLGNSNVFQSGSSMGIGTTSPRALLDVNGNINTATAYQIGQTSVVRIGNAADQNLFLGVSAGANNVVGSGKFNLFSGFQAGYSNTAGYGNVFEGYAAGYSNTIGFANVFEGYYAGLNNTTGSNNVFEGYFTGWKNTTGNQNVFESPGAGYSNTTGSGNIFVGFYAGGSNTTGSANVFEGSGAGYSNTSGNYNVFEGMNTGWNNTIGNYNVFEGMNAGLHNTTGSYNVFEGEYAGSSNTTGSYNIYIGNFGNQGNPGESNTIRVGDSSNQHFTFVAGIYGVNNGGVPVYINANGQLGTISSSRLFKDNILDMNDASSKLYQLRPVTFHYKPQYDDGTHSLQYGLIAEEVAEVYPEMVAYDKDGKPYTVKYQLLAPMLLNELQKEHRVVSEQQNLIKTQQQQLQTQQAQLQTVAGEIADLQKQLSRLESLTAKK